MGYFYPMTNMWDQRFGEQGYAYGDKGNAFMADCLRQLKTGKALFPAEGEGRNAVHAAAAGWEAVAYDPSVEGKKKALMLCERHDVTLDYHLAGHQDFTERESSFDLLVLVFAHVPVEMRRPLHQKLWRLVKPGGHLILEGFSKDQLGLSSGGPKELSMLFEKSEVQNDFSSVQWLVAEEGPIELDEGKYHQGLAHTLRLFGTKEAE